MPKGTPFAQTSNRLLERFQEFILQEGLCAPTDRLLLAVSGGLDSVVLCELCSRAELDFVIAHGNFQLRGQESLRDEDFVHQLGARYGKEVFVRRFDTSGYAAAKKSSLQAAARELRYGWFSEMLGEHQRTGGSLRLIATAHHLDDNVETVLMNFLKGTGIAGLHGILPRQGKVIRPLLFARKEECRAFALDSGLSWVEDSSNDSDKYERNYLRHHVLPQIEKIYPNVAPGIDQSIQRFREAEILYRQSIEAHKKRLLFPKVNEIQIPVLKLQRSEPLRTIIFELLRDYDFSAAQIDEVIGLMGAESGKYIQSPTHRLIKNRRWLIISPGELEQAQHVVIDGPGKWPAGNDFLRLALLPAENHRLEANPMIAQLDASQISYPLLLRRWKPGDYFYPLGMKKKKKLARFFIDHKLSQTDKEQTWVLEMQKKIIWVVGMRIDERFKIRPQTKEIFQAVFNKS